jgi:hypothetical protein
VGAISHIPCYGPPSDARPLREPTSTFLSFEDSQCRYSSTSGAWLYKGRKVFVSYSDPARLAHRPTDRQGPRERASPQLRQISYRFHRGPGSTTNGKLCSDRACIDVGYSQYIHSEQWIQWRGGVMKSLHRRWNLSTAGLIIVPGGTSLAPNLGGNGSPWRTHLFRRRLQWTSRGAFA